VALSFAGAQRPYVERVAAALKARGVRTFYDADEQVRLWGTHLAEELPRIYAQESATVVVFVSADYAGRDWTRLERRAAFSMAVTEAGVYVLPARFDDSELPGLSPDMICIDLQELTPEQFAELVAEKLAALGIPGSSLAGGGDRRPRDAPRPAGAIRVGDADPRWLGVHPAIPAAGVSGDTPPAYVERDVDGAEHGVRARLAAAAERGGFVLLVGGSSVGKTRSAYEAAKRLAALLAERGDAEGLRARADTGEWAAAIHLAALLAERGDADGLRARAAADDYAAADLLAYLGGLDGWENSAASRAKAAEWLAEHLFREDDDYGLRVRADVGDEHAARRLADLLADHGDARGLWARAQAGDEHADDRLTKLKARRAARGPRRDLVTDVLLRAALFCDDLDELRTRADAGDWEAGSRLAKLLGVRGDLDELRTRADVGDEHAARRLAGLLADRGDVEGLRARAAVGDWEAGSHLVNLLIRLGRGEEAERLRRFDLNRDGSIASGPDG
jgi:hypothetical protein